MADENTRTVAQQLSPDGAAIDVSDHSETSKDREQREDLAVTLARQLDAFNAADEGHPFQGSDEPDLEDETDDDSYGEEVDEDEDGEDEVDVDTDDDEDFEVEDQEAATPKTVVEGVPTLPESYRRSLLASGFTEADIDSNLAASPSGFLTFAKNVHEQRNAQTAQFAEQGRRLAEQEQQGVVTPGQPVQHQIHQLPNRLNLPDIETIRERVEDDKIVDDIIAPILAVGQTLQQILPTIQQGLQSVQQVEQQRTDDYIDKFFTRDEMKPFVKLYGGADRDLTPEQIDNRQRVIQEAVYIFKGKQASGIDGSVGEALQAAHDTVSADFKEVAVRKTIKKKVKQRNRGIQQRASKRQGSAVPGSNKGAPKDRSELEQRTLNRMQAAFKGFN